jgi:hypothetical protein
LRRSERKCHRRIWTEKERSRVLASRRHGPEPVATGTDGHGRPVLSRADVATFLSTMTLKHATVTRRPMNARRLHHHANRSDDERSSDDDGNDDTAEDDRYAPYAPVRASVLNHPIVGHWSDAHVHGHHDNDNDDHRDGPKSPSPEERAQRVVARARSSRSSVDASSSSLTSAQSNGDSQPIRRPQSASGTRTGGNNNNNNNNDDTNHTRNIAGVYAPISITGTAGGRAIAPPSTVPASVSTAAVDHQFAVTRRWRRRRGAKPRVPGDEPQRPPIGLDSTLFGPFFDITSTADRNRIVSVQAAAAEAAAPGPFGGRAARLSARALEDVVTPAQLSSQLKKQHREHVAMNMTGSAAVSAEWHRDAQEDITSVAASQTASEPVTHSHHNIHHNDNNNTNRNNHHNNNSPTNNSSTRAVIPPLGTFQPSWHDYERIHDELVAVNQNMHEASLAASRASPHDVPSIVSQPRIVAPLTSTVTAMSTSSSRGRAIPSSISADNISSNVVAPVVPLSIAVLPAVDPSVAAAAAASSYGPPQLFRNRSMPHPVPRTSTSGSTPLSPIPGTPTTNTPPHNNTNKDGSVRTFATATATRPQSAGAALRTAPTSATTSTTTTKSSSSSRPVSASVSRPSPTISSNRSNTSGRQPGEKPRAAFGRSISSSSSSRPTSATSSTTTTTTTTTRSTRSRRRGVSSARDHPSGTSASRSTVLPESSHTRPTSAPLHSNNDNASSSSSTITTSSRHGHVRTSSLVIPRGRVPGTIMAQSDDEQSHRSDDSSTMLSTPWSALSSFQQQKRLALRTLAYTTAAGVALPARDHGLQFAAKDSWHAQKKAQQLRAAQVAAAEWPHAPLSSSTIASPEDD